MLAQTMRDLTSLTIVRIALSYLVGQWICCALFAACAVADERVTFELSPYDEPIMLPATIGSRQCLCILDSGASVHAFHTTLQSELGAPLKTRTALAADGKEFEVQVFKPPVASIRMRPLATSAPVACFDLSSIQAATGREIEGILGMPLFRAHVIQVDFDRRSIEFLPSDTLPAEEWGQVAFASGATSGLPQIEVSVADRPEVNCVVDTGHTGTISLSSVLFSDLLENGMITPVEDLLIAQANGIHRIRQGRLTRLRIGAFEHEDVPVCDGGNKTAIGVEYLRRYRVTFDLGRGRLFLSKGDRYSSRDKHVVVGFGLIRTEGRMKIALIQPNSLAEKAGLLVNDELVSIDSTVVNELPLAEVRWMLRKKADENETIVEVDPIGWTVFGVE